MDPAKIDPLLTLQLEPEDDEHPCPVFVRLAAPASGADLAAIGRHGVRAGKAGATVFTANLSREQIDALSQLSCVLRIEGSSQLSLKAL